VLKQSKLVDDDFVKAEKLDLKSAENIAETIVTQVDAWCDEIDIVGSIRRMKNYVHDIDFVVLPKSDKDWNNLKNTVLTMMDTKPILKGDQILRAWLKMTNGEYVQIDFYRATAENYGSVKLMRTGSAENNIFLAKLAIKKGLRWLHTKGIINASNERVIAGETEVGVFTALGLPFIEPSQREIVGGKPLWWK
jgi:DNA polymerase (family 10)